MESRGRVVCPENKALEDYVWTKWQSMVKGPKPISKNSEKAVQKAYLNVCGSKTPILTLKEFSNVKGDGKWILKLMQGFFADDQAAVVADTDLAPKEGREMVRILIAAGANPIAQDAQHRTALHAAAMANDEELVKFIMAAAIEAHLGCVEGRKVEAKNEWPHVTVWNAHGVAAKEANDLPHLHSRGNANRVEIDVPIVVNGEVEFF